MRGSPSTMQTLGDYNGHASLMRAIPQSSKRARGKHKGNKVRLPSWNYNEGFDVMRMVHKGTHKARTARLSPREQAVVADLQGQRLRLLQLAGNNSHCD